MACEGLAVLNTEWHPLSWWRAGESNPPPPLNIKKGVKEHPPTHPPLEDSKLGALVRVVTSQGGGSIMLWVDFTYDYNMALEVIEGNMTAVKYINEILRDVILPFQQAHPAETFILVDDNATSHRARVVTAYKHADNISTEDWQARSPDLSVIEHAWDMLQRVVNAQQPAPDGLADLSVAVQGDRNNLGQDKLMQLVPQRSKRVAWCDPRQGKLHPLLTPRTPLSVTVCTSEWKINLLIFPLLFIYWR